MEQFMCEERERGKTGQWSTSCHTHTRPDNGAIHVTPLAIPVDKPVVCGACSRGIQAHACMVRHRQTWCKWCKWCNMVKHIQSRGQELVPHAHIYR